MIRQSCALLTISLAIGFTSAAFAKTTIDPTVANKLCTKIKPTRAMVFDVGCKNFQSRYNASTKMCAITASCPIPQPVALPGAGNHPKPISTPSTIQESCHIPYLGGVGVFNSQNPTAAPTFAQPIVRFIKNDPPGGRLHCMVNRGKVAQIESDQAQAFMKPVLEATQAKLQNCICVENAMSTGGDLYLKVSANGGGLSSGYSNSDETRCWKATKVNVYACGSKFSGSSCEFVGNFKGYGRIKITGNTNYVFNSNPDGETLRAHVSPHVTFSEDYIPITDLPEPTQVPAACQ